MKKSISIAILTMILSSVAFAAVTHLKIGTKKNELAYDKSKLSAKAGTVEIVFTNQSDPDAGMPHNFILVKPGTNTDELAAPAITAGDAKHYIPDSPAILKNTGLLKAGESETITVDLQPGIYPYFCSYPGHPATMKGKLTVK